MEGLRTIPMDLYSGEGSLLQIQTRFTISATGNSSKLAFENEHFTLAVIVSDLVDLDDFCAFVRREKPKIVLQCILKKGDKVYSGKRKLIWKGDGIVVSAGGVRIELPGSSVPALRKVAEFLKQSFSR
jgi:hypothetical protein